MKYLEKIEALQLRKQGYSINHIATSLGVAKSSVSVWVRHITLDEQHVSKLSMAPYSRVAIERRRTARLRNEAAKRQIIIDKAALSVPTIDKQALWLIGLALYMGEGGKTQRLVRISNGDPKILKLALRFFRECCDVPESKFRCHIHIHPHLDFRVAESYWSEVTDIPLDRFFKTYRKPNKSSQNKRDTLPFGVLDVIVLDTRLFLRIQGWIQGIHVRSLK